MSLADLVPGQRRALVSIVIELGGLAVAATGVMWLGGLKERVALIEERLERMEARQLAGSEARRRPDERHAGLP